MIGFLNINKKQGISSAAVVNKVKRLLPKGTKVGHMGTLDPIASGVLPIAVGRATRLFDLMQNKTKEYLATFKFGYTTDSLDITGEITKTTTVIPTEKQVLEALPSFVGVIQQTPPIFSAKSVDGVRAYEKARKGENFELKSCNVTIYSFNLIEKIDSTTYKFKVVCGSGTYIRSLCRDLGEKLGSLAVMTELLRTKTGPFCLENSQGCDNINTDKMLKIEEVLTFKKMELTQEQLTTLLQGKKVEFKIDDDTYLCYFNNELQLILNIKNGVGSNKIWLR